MAHKGSGLRIVFRAHLADTDEIVSRPYYNAAACYRMARIVAFELGREVIVKRDGRPNGIRFGPGG